MNRYDFLMKRTTVYEQGGHIVKRWQVTGFSLSFNGVLDHVNTMRIQRIKLVVGKGIKEGWKKV